MKNKIFVVSTSILFLMVALIMLINNSSTTITGSGEIKYAITVDGIMASEFPSGNYQVDVNCSNSNGYWDNTNKKIVVNDIVGDVICNIDFKTITTNDYLNNYLINNEQNENGLFVHKIDALSTDNATWIKTNMNYQNISGNSMILSNNDYTGSHSVTNSKGKHKFYPLTNGYYRMCYEVPSSDSTTESYAERNILLIYPLNNNQNIMSGFYSNTKSGVSLTGCIEFGYITTDDFIYLEDTFYDKNIILSFQKTNDIDSIDTGYRYIGANPNNYIIFNNESWRIVGVFNSESHGHSGKQLVKIIRNSSIGSLIWNAYNSGNDWPNSKLYHLLNEPYYDWDNYSNVINSYCYGSSSALANCDYTVKGIQNSYRNMVKNVTWYLGGGGQNGYTEYIPIKAYKYERNANLVYSDGTNTNASSTTGYIGLLYVSDFLYASNTCLKPFSYYSNLANTVPTICLNGNWIYTGSEGWTLTHNSSTNNKAFLFGKGENYNSNTLIREIHYGHPIYPVLYLSENVYRVSGIGTQTDPYIIGLASS